MLRTPQLPPRRKIVKHYRQQQQKAVAFYFSLSDDGRCTFFSEYDDDETRPKPLFESRSSAKYSRLLSQLFYWLNSPSARTVRYENRFRMEREPRGERKEAGTTYSDGVVCHPTKETTLCGLCWVARQVSSLPPITERIRRRTLLSSGEAQRVS